MASWGEDVLMMTSPRIEPNHLGRRQEDVLRQECLFDIKPAWPCRPGL